MATATTPTAASDDDEADHHAAATANINATTTIDWVLVGRDAATGHLLTSAAAAAAAAAAADGLSQHECNYYKYSVGGAVYDRKSKKSGRVVVAVVAQHQHCSCAVCAVGVGDATTNSCCCCCCCCTPTHSHQKKVTVDEDAPSSEQQQQPPAKKKKMAQQKTAAGKWMVRFDGTGASPDSDNNTTTRGEGEEALTVIVEVESRQLIPIYADVQNAAVSATSKKNCPTNNTIVMVTARTDLYRLLAASQVVGTGTSSSSSSSSICNVLEIGSSTGCTSEIVWKSLMLLRPNSNNNDNNNVVSNNNKWIGFDTGSDMVKTVQRKLQKIEMEDRERLFLCVKMDPLKDPETAAALVIKHFTAGVAPTTAAERNMTVLVDIGGNREEAGVLRMIQWVLDSFGNNVRQIILKSEAVYAALQQQQQQNGASLSSTAAFSNNDDSSNDWYKRRLRVALRDSLPKHPLQAPKRFCPGTSIHICRYHNYHAAGCSKRDNATNNSACPYDHVHCHVCLKPGHIARACPLIRLPEE